MSYLLKAIKLLLNAVFLVVVFFLLINTTFLIFNMFGYDKYIPIYDTALWSIKLFRLKDTDIIFSTKLTVNLMIEILSLYYFVSLLTGIFERVQFFFTDFRVVNVRKKSKNSLDDDIVTADDMIEGIEKKKMMHK